jgi:hypothetical protein
VIARLIWIAALLGLAVVSTFAQVDRGARFAPQLAPMVPIAFRGFAQQRLTEIALAEGDGDLALAQAQRLALVRPLAAENLALLSQAALLAGQDDTGLAALEEAGRRGWREPAAQRAMAMSALLTQDWEAASQRIVALLATAKLEDAVIQPLVAELAQTPAGRAALARRLAESGHWQGKFVPAAAAYLPPAAYADLIVQARTLNAVLDCNGLQNAAIRLQNRGAQAAADRFWPGDCPAG